MRAIGLHKILSTSELQEWLECSKQLILTVDETIALTPISPAASVEQKSLRILFMNARTASYEICLLADSLLNNESHHFSRSIEYSMRLLWESMIDYFYISQSGESAAQRYLEFLDVVNTSDSDERKNKHTAFKHQYPGTNRGDYWSGESREDKADKGIMSNPSYSRRQSCSTEDSFIDLIKPTFEYLNEQVHGNSMFGSYWSFNKHSGNELEYRRQIAAGLLKVLFFYWVSHHYCIYNGRVSEVERFRFYASYVKECFGKARASIEQ